ncbi:MAG: hypothetical protein H0W30_10285 [Gemmatimonadaceae bacterium]|nr:hypothetical protein [Gemmatimonadaceae bacterium]MDQ3520064.1 hypothetical protein [Gemmatimonadota bacterium]
MKSLYLIVLCAALTACSGGEPAVSDTAASDTVAAPVPAASADVPANTATVMQVVLTGGKDPGTYNASSMGRTCSVGTNEIDVWASQFTDDTASKGLSTLQVTIPGAAKAKAGASEFNVGIVIGNFMQGNDYSIETRSTVKPSRGTGTAKVDDDGTTATITVKGTTATGVGIDATVKCIKVSRGR